MGTILILFLILFPLAVAFLLLVARVDVIRDVIVRLAALAIAAGAVWLTVEYFLNGEQKIAFHHEEVGYAMMGIEALLGLYIICIGLKHKKPLASLFVAIQVPLIIWFELTKVHGNIDAENNLYFDGFTVIMVLIIGIIGTLICVYALGYMKDFKQHHPGEKDRRPWFFFLLFLFLSAMFGIVLTNNLTWLYFFWEITTLCSFFLIGFTKTGEAINNSFKALIMNLLGGLGFVVGIMVLGSYYQTIELSTMIAWGPVAAFPAAFFVFAGITKAAQMPFNSWLLGAMVAPTPTSALLHSSTMVKAGVFIVIKLAPCLASGGTSLGAQTGNIVGLMVVMVGGITFLMATLAAISQSNAKRVLAYSTVANLGLIVTCGGIGTPEAVWAGIMLIIFHAVTKSLLFLCVGTAEHNIGSRDIEDMDGLFGKMPRLAAFMLAGIAGMFLAPFGMLISKWASLTAFVDSRNIILIAIICFGSAATAFYWTKWMGKLSAIMANRENIQQDVHKDEWFSLGTHVILTIMACLSFPLISKAVLVPYLEQCIPMQYLGMLQQSMDGQAQAQSLIGTYTGVSSSLSDSNMMIMIIMVAVIVVLIGFGFGKSKKRIVPIYLSGVNTGDNLEFHGSMQRDVSVSLRNWHMETYFGEIKMNRIGVITTAVIIVAGLSVNTGMLMALGSQIMALITGGGAQ